MKFEMCKTSTSKEFKICENAETVEKAIAGGFLKDGEPYFLLPDAKTAPPLPDAKAKKA